MSLLGTWVIDESDEQTVAELGDVLLDFRADGQLVYTVRSETRKQVILMRYNVRGDTIITDQPSAPREEQTAYSVSPDGILTLGFGGQPYRFRRP